MSEPREIDSAQIDDAEGVRRVAAKAGVSVEDIYRLAAAQFPPTVKVSL
jgi:hypothetical protein